MQTIDINKKLVEGYLALFRNLSKNSKLDLISGLSASLKSSEHKGKLNSLKSLEGDFIDEKSADEIISDLKSSRTFTRSLDSLFSTL